MNRKFKPKPVSLGIIILAIVICLAAISMIVFNFLAGEFRSDGRFYLALAIASFFLLAAIYALSTFKIITISATHWKVRKMLGGKEIHSFSDEEILRVSRFDGVVYKSGKSITTYTVLLKNGETFKVTSDSITDFNLFEDAVRKFLK